MDEKILAKMFVALLTVNIAGRKEEIRRLSGLDPNLQKLLQASDSVDAVLHIQVPENPKMAAAMGVLVFCKKKEVGSNDSGSVSGMQISLLHVLSGKNAPVEIKGVSISDPNVIKLLEGAKKIKAKIDVTIQSPVPTEVAGVLGVLVFGAREKTKTAEVYVVDTENVAKFLATPFRPDAVKYLTEEQKRRYIGMGRGGYALHEAGLKFVWQAVSMSREELLSCYGFGKKSLDIFLGILDGMGLELGMDLSPYMDMLPQPKQKSS